MPESVHCGFGAEIFDSAKLRTAVTSVPASSNGLSNLPALFTGADGSYRANHFMARDARAYNRVSHGNTGVSSNYL